MTVWNINVPGSSLSFRLERHRQWRFNPFTNIGVPGFQVLDRNVSKRLDCKSYLRKNTQHFFVKSTGNKNRRKSGKDHFTEKKIGGLIFIDTATEELELVRGKENFRWDNMNWDLILAGSVLLTCSSDRQWFESWLVLTWVFYPFSLF